MKILRYMVNIRKLTGYILISLFLICKISDAQNSDFNALREQMVKTQIEARGISDPAVLNAFLEVKRHQFVLPEYISRAYGDYPLPIDEGQTISQPYIVAYMTQALQLKSTDKVLEVGTGSGYQAAILAKICDSVYTIEIFESLGKKAKALFDELGYDNIHTKIGDGYKGWPEHAPFDAIIVTAAPNNVPEPLKKQLAEGGRMIIPVGKNSSVQQLILLEKLDGKIQQKNVLPVRFVPMIDADGNTY